MSSLVHKVGFCLANVFFLQNVWFSLATCNCGLTSLLHVRACFPTFHNGVKKIRIVTWPSRRKNSKLVNELYVKLIWRFTFTDIILLLLCIHCEILFKRFLKYTKRFYYFLFQFFLFLIVKRFLQIFKSFFSLSMLASIIWHWRQYWTYWRLYWRQYRRSNIKQLKSIYGKATFCIYEKGGTCVQQLVRLIIIYRGNLSALCRTSRQLKTMQVMCKSGNEHELFGLFLHSYRMIGKYWNYTFYKIFTRTTRLKLVKNKKKLILFSGWEVHKQ